MRLYFTLVLWKEAVRILSQNPSIEYAELARLLDCSHQLAVGVTIDYRSLIGLKPRIGEPSKHLSYPEKQPRKETNRRYYKKKVNATDDVRYPSRSGKWRTAKQTNQ